MKRLLFAVFAAATACGATPALAQTPAPSPGWTADFYTGGTSVITTGQKHEYLSARLEAQGPLGGGLSAVLRADAAGTQDGGSIDFTNPKTFRDVEVNAGLKYRAGAVDVIASGGVTFSIEGTIGAPVDPRLYTGLGLVAVPLKGGGYAGFGAGHYGPVGGGLALVATSSIPMGSSGAFTTIDYALPLQAAATGRHDYLLRIGATVRVASLSLGGLFGR